MDTNAAQRQRRLLIVLLLSFGLAMILMGANEQQAGAGNDANASPTPTPVPPTPAEQEWTAKMEAISRQISVAAGPAIFPANLTFSERFGGHWHAQRGAPDIGGVRPHPAPNVSVNYYLLGGWTPPADPPFAQPKGQIRLQLRSVSRLPALPSLQKTDAFITLFDSGSDAYTGGAALDGSPILEFAATGVYLADEGLVLLVTPGNYLKVPAVAVDFGDNTAAAGNANAGVGGGRLAEDATGAPTPAEPSPSAAPAAAPAAAESVAAGSDDNNNVLTPAGCDIVWAFRLRPIGFDFSVPEWSPAASPTPQAAQASPTPAGRRLAAAQQQQQKQPGTLVDIMLQAVADAAAHASSERDDAEGAPQDATAAADDGVEEEVEDAASGVDMGRVQQLMQSEELREIFFPHGACTGGAAAARKEEAGGPRGGTWMQQHARTWLQQLLGAVTGGDASGTSHARHPLQPAGDDDRSRRLERVPLAASLASAKSPFALLASHVDAGAAASAQGTESAGSDATPAAAPATGGPRRLASQDPRQRYRGFTFLPLAGVAVSRNCNFTLNISASASVYDPTFLEEKATGYAIMATAAGILLMAVVTYQVVAASGQSAASRVSLATVGMMACLDAYMTLIHMVAGVVNINVLSSFATTAFVFLMLFAVLEMRFMLLVWKARRGDAFAGGWDAVRREIGMLYCRFYGVLMLGLVLVYFGSTAVLRLATLAIYSFWLPQIIHCVQNDCRPGLTRGFIIITSILRMLIPWYVLYCPNNLLYEITPIESRDAAMAWADRSVWSGGMNAWLPPGASGATGSAPWSSYASATTIPDPGGVSAPALATPAMREAYESGARFATLLTAWMALQVTVLLLQGKAGWGARFFIPAVFLPQKYDYHRRITVVDGRLQPDSAATHAFTRTRAAQQRAAAEAAAAAAGAGGGANGAAGGGQTPALGTRVSAAIARRVDSARDTARTTWEGFVWFGVGLRLLAIDWRERAQARWRRLTGGSGPVISAGVRRPPISLRAGAVSGAAGGRYERVADTADDETEVEGQAVGGAVAAAGPPGGAAGDVEAGGSTAGAAAAADGEGDVPAAADRRSATTSEAAAARERELDELVAATGEPQSIDCVVCMDAIEFPVQRRVYAVTPCDHIFHAECLMPWLETKLECPTCRMGLPEP